MCHSNSKEQGMFLEIGQYWAMTNKQSSEDGTLSEDEINWLLIGAEGFGIIPP